MKQKDVFHSKAWECEWHTDKCSREEARHARMCGGHMVPCNAHTLIYKSPPLWLWMAIDHSKCQRMIYRYIYIHLKRGLMIVLLCLFTHHFWDTTEIKEEEMEPLLCLHHQIIKSHISKLSIGSLGSGFNYDYISFIEFLC